jgi:hypothetical protein
MVTERDEPESDEILGKVSRGRDLVADVTDGFASRLDVGALAARCILEKDDVARIGLSVKDLHEWALDLQRFIVGFCGIRTILLRMLGAG